MAEFIIKNAGEYQSEMAITDPFTGYYHFTMMYQGSIDVHVSLIVVLNS